MRGAERKTSGRRSRRRLAWALPLWLIFVVLLAEGGVRVAALLLSRSAPAFGGSGSGRVVYCIGDSFTYGTGVSRARAWPKVLERRLGETFPARRYTVRNLGWPGLSSSNAVYAVAQALRADDAALILVMTGWNANNTDFQALAEERGRPAPLRTRIDTFCDHSRLYRLLKQAVSYRRRTAVLDGVRIVPQAPGMSLYDFRAYQEIADRNLRRIVALCRRFDAPLVLLNYPYQDLPDNPYTKNEYYHFVFGRTPLSSEDYVVRDRAPDEIAIHAVIRRVAEEEGVPIVDLHEAFVRSGRSDLFQEDLHHPTGAGHEIIAEAILDHVRPRLDGGPGGAASP